MRGRSVQRRRLHPSPPFDSASAGVRAPAGRRPAGGRLRGCVGSSRCSSWAGCSGSARAMRERERLGDAGPEQAAPPIHARSCGPGCFELQHRLKLTLRNDGDARSRSTAAPACAPLVRGGSRPGAPLDAQPGQTVAVPIDFGDARCPPGDRGGVALTIAGEPQRIPVVEPSDALAVLNERQCQSVRSRRLRHHVGDDLTPAGEVVSGRTTPRRRALQPDHTSGRPPVRAALVFNLAEVGGHPSVAVGSEQDRRRSTSSSTPRVATPTPSPNRRRPSSSSPSSSSTTARSSPRAARGGPLRRTPRGASPPADRPRRIGGAPAGTGRPSARRTPVAGVVRARGGRSRRQPSTRSTRWQARGCERGVVGLCRSAGAGGLPAPSDDRRLRLSSGDFVALTDGSALRPGVPAGSTTTGRRSGPARTMPQQFTSISPRTTSAAGAGARQGATRPEHQPGADRWRRCCSWP